MRGNEYKDTATHTHTHTHADEVFSQEKIMITNNLPQ